MVAALKRSRYVRTRVPHKCRTEMQVKRRNRVVCLQHQTRSEACSVLHAASIDLPSALPRATTGGANYHTSPSYSGRRAAVDLGESGEGRTDLKLDSPDKSNLRGRDDEGQLRGLSGDPALGGQCGKVGGFEGGASSCASTTAIGW